MTIWRRADGPAFFACVLTLSLASCASKQGPPAPQYSIKESAPAVGSNIRRNTMEGSRIPINRKYSELTPEEKAIVHGWWEHIPEGDEPPYPAEGLKSIHDAMAKAQEKLSVSGKLFLVATVEPDGTVSAVKVVGAPSQELVKFAGQVLLLTKFKPASCRGKPCKMDFPLQYNFTLR